MDRMTTHHHRGPGSVTNPMRRLARLGALLLLVSGCQTPPASVRDGAVPLPVWPPPPAAPRIAYMGSIRGPADLGASLSVWRRFSNLVTGANRGREPFVRPLGIALDESGNLCLTDPGSRTVCYFEWETRRFSRWDAVGSFAFESPVGIAKHNGVIYVADSGRAKIVAFNEDGDLLFEIEEGLQRPVGVTVARDRLWVADSKAHCVLGYSLDGNLMTKIGRRGSGPGEFNFPTYVCADAAGRLFVTDSMNFRVQILDDKGTFLGAWGQAGDTSGSLSRPAGLAVDPEGHVYVVDALFDNVQIFEEGGQLLLYWGGAGSGPGEFWLPAGIAVGRDNRIFVVDSYNQRIQVFRRIDESG